MTAPDHLHRQHDRTPKSIRQIAILLHTLPERTHRVLLGQLGSDAKQDITDVMLMLGEIDAMEQYRVLKRMRDELEAETRSVEKVESEIQDEIQIGRARVSKKRAAPIYRSAETVVTVAHEKADAAANANVASMAAEHFADDSLTSETAEQPTDGSASDRVQTLFARFHQTQAAGVLAMPHPDRGGIHNRQRSLGQTSPEPSARNVLPIRNTVPVPLPERGPDCHHDQHDDDQESLAERVDQFLNQLPPQELCRALGMVTTKQAFFVLCGLPNEISESVLELLPRKQSRKVRSDMRRMGQLQLADIDSAKQVVTEIAIRMTTRPQSFAA